MICKYSHLSRGFPAVYPPAPPWNTTSHGIKTLSPEAAASGAPVTYHLGFRLTLKPEGIEFTGVRTLLKIQLSREQRLYKDERTRQWTDLRKVFPTAGTLFVVSCAGSSRENYVSLKTVPTLIRYLRMSQYWEFHDVYWNLQSLGSIWDIDFLPLLPPGPILHPISSSSSPDKNYNDTTLYHFRISIRKADA